MKRTAVTLTCVLLIVALLLPTGGCADMFERLGWSKKRPPEPRPDAIAQSNPALADTVGAYALLGSAQDARVRGFSLVVGLGENGSRDCPSAIREYLVEFLTREFESNTSMRRRARFSPQRLIDAPDSAVVEVSGRVPAGAPRGMAFDVRVAAVGGTQTRTLEGGLLLPCDLKIVQAAAGREALVGGKVVARARGPISTNPFVAADKPRGPGDPRRGFVLGGGRTTIERPVRLDLTEPSYSTARRLEQRINERFGHMPKAAEAMSKGYVELHTPPVHARDPQRFIQLATHLYLHNQPAYYERKLNDLSRLLTSGLHNRDHIALVWEGIGRVGVARLQAFYEHDDPAVRFFSARTGLRLHDFTAVPILTRIAQTPEHPYRLLAVRELGECGFAAAAVVLQPLLDADDPEIRIAAYEGLLRHRHPLIRTQRFASALDRTQVNMVLDVIETSGEPMIYVRRTREPRIAVFGDRTPVVLPIFYSHPEQWVTLNAATTTDDITMFCRSRGAKRLSDRLFVPPRLVDLIIALGDLPERNAADQLRGIGLSFSQVVQVLDALRRDGSIDAPIVLERESLTELLGPTKPPRDRPEVDEPGAAEQDAPPDQPREPTKGEAKR